MSQTPDTPDTPGESSSNKGVEKLSILLQLWPFIAPYKMLLVAALLALLVTAGASLAIGQGIRLLIDQGFIGGSLAQLNAAVLFLGGITLAVAVGTFVRFYLISWLGERVVADMRKAVFSRLLSLPPSYFESNRSGEIMSRLTTDTSLLQNIIGSSLSMAVRNLLTFTGGLVLLLITNLKLSLVVLACVPLVLGPILIYGRRVRSLSRQSQDSIAGVGSYAGEVIDNIKTVQSYNREHYEQSAFDSEAETAFNVARQRIKMRAALIATVICLVFGAVTGMIWLGGYDVLTGKMSGGDLGAFVFYAVVVASAVATISEVFGELQRAAGAAERLLELLSERSPIAQASEQAVAPGSASLSFNQLSFHYPSRPQQPALENFTLEVEAGQSVALVGPSGAGKSTVFELAQRFFDAQAGEVVLGGQDIRQLTLVQLREQMALVPQQPDLFTADVMHNIRYGNLAASDEKVIAAAKAAHADEFIARLPDGYQTQLGEKGARLSGGQRQRIAIARAILKDPKILLLDEATSALDAESEYHVQQALDQLMKGRTTLIIAHRLATIKHADKIAVMDRGQLVAIGNHQQLLESSSLYKRLADLQFSEPASTLR